MNKKIVWTLLLPLFFLQLISSLELRLSPAYLNLETKAGEQACQDMTIYSDKSTDITIKDQWTGIERSRNLEDYNLTSGDMDIIPVFPGKISVSADKEKNIEVCFLPEEAGKFYGAVLFESDGYASIGSWIELDATRGQEKFIPLTGEIIGIGKGSNLLFIGLFSIMLEGLILFILAKKVNPQKINKKI